MRRLKDRSQGPPDFFRYKHPETGHITEARDFVTWIDKAKEHRRSNSLPIDDELPMRMEDQLCSTIPPDLWEYEKEGDLSWVDTRINVKDVVDFTRVLIAQAQTGNQFVSQEEANRRASICSGCYLNVRIAGCAACNQLMDLVVGRSTAYDKNLQSCAVCKCHLAAAVHIPMETLLTNDSEWKQSHYPKFCWKQTKSDNFQR